MHFNACLFIVTNHGNIPRVWINVSFYENTKPKNVKKKVHVLRYSICSIIVRYSITFHNYATTNVHMSAWQSNLPCHQPKIISCYIWYFDWWQFKKCAFYVPCCLMDGCVIMKGAVSCIYSKYLSRCNVFKSLFSSYILIVFVWDADCLCYVFQSTQSYAHYKNKWKGVLLYCFSVFSSM